MEMGPKSSDYESGQVGLQSFDMDAPIDEYICAKNLGHPRKRWDSDVKKFLQCYSDVDADWKEAAADASFWNSLEAAFVIRDSI
eukprot:3797177-Karenia_brevis.AAC.1